MISEQDAYWAGFVMADGCITQGRNKLEIELARKDEGHLYSFKSYVRSDNPVRRRDKSGYLTSRFCFSDKDLINLYNCWGITSNKFDNTASADLSNDKHFWRGLIDGDGSLGHYVRATGYNDYKLSLVGGPNLLEQYRQFVNKNFGTEATVRQSKRSKSCVISIEAKKARLLAHFLYDGAVIALPRKAAIVDSWKDSR